MGGGQKAGVIRSPHCVTLCGIGVPGALRGDENFLEERSLSQTKERVQEGAPGGRGARAQTGRKRVPVGLSPLHLAGPPLAGARQRLNEDVLLERQETGDPESCVFPFRSDQDNLKMPSNAHLTFSTSLLGCE